MNVQWIGGRGRTLGRLISMLALGLGCAAAAQ